MSDTLVDRLRARMKELGLKPGAVADQAGVGHSFVHDILLGRSLNPTTEKLGRVAAVLKISVEHLLNGTLPASDPEAQLPDKSFTSVPFVNITASMGGGAIIEDESNVGTWLFPDDWLREEFVGSPATLRLIRVGGDSMEPTLRNGDIVMLDVSKTSPAHGGIFVLDDGMGLVAKRLDRVLGTAPPLVRIISDNPQYPGYERRLDEVRIIGKVVWFARRID